MKNLAALAAAALIGFAAPAGAQDASFTIDLDVKSLTPEARTAYYEYLLPFLIENHGARLVSNEERTPCAVFPSKGAAWAALLDAMREMDDALAERVLSHAGRLPDLLVHDGAGCAVG